MKYVFAMLVAVCACAVGVAQGAASAPAQKNAVVPHWVASWASSQMAPEPVNNQPGIDASLLKDATVRQIVHLSTGGDAVRLELSNVFGTRYLVFDSIHVARAKSAGSAAIDAATDHAVTVFGKAYAVVPPGATYFSDPIYMDVPALSDLAVTFHFANAPQGETLHQGSHETSYLLHGDHATDAELTGAAKEERWLNLGEVDVRKAAPGATLVCFGDSITDGHASTTNGNDRWPDFLAAHFASAPQTAGWGVVNEGIGGNHLLTDGLGENAVGRLDRDLIAVTDVHVVIVLEGINDVGMLARGKNASATDHAQLVEAMEAALTQIVEQAHTHGIRVIGATIMPFMGSDYYKPTAANEADREAVNAWLRSSKDPFDQLLDLDATMRDPKNPSQLLPAYDSGDHLHPGPVGYKAMGDAVWAAISK
jgi:lysophospholipase L1-like esterase